MLEGSKAELPNGDVSCKGAGPLIFDLKLACRDCGLR